MQSEFDSRTNRQVVVEFRSLHAQCIQFHIALYHIVSEMIISTRWLCTISHFFI